MTTPITRLISIINNPKLKLSKENEQAIVFYLKRLQETQLENKRILQQNRELQQTIYEKMNKKIRINKYDAAIN